MPNTVTIAATKANTTRAIEYSVDGGLTWADANIFTAVPAGTLTIGQVKARLVGSSPAIVATWGSAVVVTDGATGAVVEYLVDDSSWRQTNTKLAQNGGFLRNTAAYIEFTTAATVLELNGISSMGNIGYGPGDFGVFVDGAFQDVLVPGTASSGPAAGWASVMGLTAGIKTIRVQVHPLARTTPGTEGTVGTALLKFRANAAPAYTAPLVRPAAYSFLGTSITGGSLAANRYTSSYAMLLRTALAATTHVSVDSVDGGSFIEIGGTSAQRTVLWDRQKLLLTGTANNTVILDHGTNDSGRNTATAAQFGTAVAAYLDYALANAAGIPGLRFVVITSLTVASGDGLLETFRVQLRDIANSRISVQLIEGPLLMAGTPVGTGSISGAIDGVHPSTAQHQEIFNNLHPLLAAGPLAPQAGATFKNGSFDAGSVTNPNAGWVASSANVTIANGVATYTTATVGNSTFLSQNVLLVRGASYRIEFKLNSISGAGAFISLQTTGQNGQIHPHLQGPGTGGTTGIWQATFVATNVNDTFALAANDVTQAVIEYCTLVAIPALPEIVKNFDFLLPAASTPTTGWVLGAGLSISGGNLVGTNVPAGTTATQTIPTTPGRRYRAYGVVLSGTAGVVLSETGGQFSPAVLNTGSIIDRLWTAGTSTATLVLTADTAGSSFAIDYLVVQDMGTGFAVVELVNSEFVSPVTSDPFIGWVPAVPGPAPDYLQAGGTATIAGGVGNVDQNNSLWQKINLVIGGIYRLDMKLDAITGGAAAQLISTAGDGQINEFFGGTGTGRTPGVYSRTFTSSVELANFGLNVAGTGTATVDYVRIIRIG